MESNFWANRRKQDKYDPSLAEKVLALWNITETPLRVEDLGGAFNHNWRITLPSQDIVIRVRPAWITPHRLQDIHQLLASLNELGVKTPVPRKSKYGNTFETIDGRMVEMYDYLPEAGNRTWSTKRWQASFEHMGKLHQALAQLAFDITPPRVSNYASPQLSLMLLKNTQITIEAMPESRNRPEAIAICQEAVRVMERVINYFGNLEVQLPFMLVHGDFHLSNLLFDQQGQVAYTLDFDFAGWRERVYEIAYSLRLAMPQLMDNSDGVLNLELIRGWLEAYNANMPQPLTPVEREALPYQFAQVALFFVAYAGLRQNPLWVVLRESSYVELACYLVRCPEAIQEQ